MAHTTDTLRAVDLPRIVRLADMLPTEKMVCVLPGQKVLIDPTPTELELLRIFASFAPQTGLEAVTQAQCRRCNGRGEIAHVLDALESMADQYLQIKDKEGRKRYDHVFMSAGEACLDVLIAAGRIPSWMDYREGGEPPSTDNDQTPARNTP